MSLAKVLEAHPELEPVLEQVAAHLLELRADYKETHWGNEGDWSVQVYDAPDLSRGVVVLGELVAVTYRVAKGDPKKEDWEHEFEGALPIVAYTPDSRDLVILRGPSSYTVTARGIEG